MSVMFRMPRPLWSKLQEDLGRPHAFAFERVAFVTCRQANTDSGLLLLAHAFVPVADEHYLHRPGAAATISGAAFSEMLGVAYREPVSIFHVHRHDHHGDPDFSGLDLAESRRFVPDFWKVRPELPHGALVLSYDSICGFIWRKSQKEPQAISHFTIVGVPAKETIYEDD